jgi:hypothetical protein
MFRTFVAKRQNNGRQGKAENFRIDTGNDRDRLPYRHWKSGVEVEDGLPYRHWKSWREECAKMKSRSLEIGPVVPTGTGTDRALH